MRILNWEGCIGGNGKTAQSAKNANLCFADGEKKVWSFHDWQAFFRGWELGDGGWRSFELGVRWGLFQSTKRREKGTKSLAVWRASAAVGGKEEWRIGDGKAWSWEFVLKAANKRRRKERICGRLGRAAVVGEFFVFGIFLVVSALIFDALCDWKRGASWEGAEIVEEVFAMEHGCKGDGFKLQSAGKKPLSADRYFCGVGLRRRFRQRPTVWPSAPVVFHSFLPCVNGDAASVLAVLCGLSLLFAELPKVFS